MRDDGNQVCVCCGKPRRVFVVFEDKRGEFEVCAACVGQDLVKRKKPTLGDDKLG